MKNIILFLLLSLPVLGQRSDTVFKVVFNATTTTGPSAPITNNGQSYHLITYIVTSTPAHTCSIFWTNGQIQLEGSFDNVTYSRIGQPVTSLQEGFPAQSWAWGAYPYIRLNYIAGNTVDCALTANYSGSLTGSKTSAFFDSTVKTGLFSIQFTTIGAGNFVAATCPSLSRYAGIYGFVVNNTTAGTITGVKLQTIDTTGTGSVLDYVNLGSMATLATVVERPSDIPIVGANQGLSNAATLPVSFVVAASAAGITGTILGRCE
jgi:hypothetical protein